MVDHIYIQIYLYMVDHMCCQAIITLTPEEEQRLQQQLVERLPAGRRLRRPVATIANWVSRFWCKKIFDHLVLFLHASGDDSPEYKRVSEAGCVQERPLCRRPGGRRLLAAGNRMLKTQRHGNMVLDTE